ncbi:hypothetical protein Tco_1283901 [Tanacetum coccineum]
MRVQTQVESDVAMTKIRHGNRAAMQFVFIPKAKPNTVSEVPDHSLTLTPEFGPGVTSEARLTRVVSLCVGPTPEPITPDQPLSLQDQILNHVSSLETLIKQHNEKSGTLITPIRLTFGEEVNGDRVKDKGIGVVEVDDDLKKPYKEVLESPFTRQIIEFSAPSHRMPTNLRIYDGSTDPDDHISRFVGAANQGEWEMPVWCRMFQQTLDGCSGGYANISLYEQLQVPRVGETIHRPSTTDGYINDETVQGGGVPRGEGYNAYNRIEHYQPYVPPRQPGRRYKNCRFKNRRQKVNQLSLESLVKRPKETLAIELQLQLPPPPPLVGAPKKENLDRYCDYYRENVHYTNDCFQLKSQLEIALKSRKLNHLIKDVRQRAGNCGR